MTIAAYLVEGNITKDLSQIKEMAYKRANTYGKDNKLLTNIIIEHLRSQIESGADITKYLIPIQMY